MSVCFLLDACLLLCPEFKIVWFEKTCLCMCMVISMKWTSFRALLCLGLHKFGMTGLNYGCKGCGPTTEAKEESIARDVGEGYDALKKK